MAKISFKSLIILGIFIANFALGQDYLNDKRTLITIGEEEVSVAEFLRVYNKNNVRGEVIDKKSIDEYLDLYINFKLKVKEAEDLGMDTVKSFIEELDGYRTQLTKPYFIDDKVNEDLLKEAYDRKLRDIRASHILIRLEENATSADTLKAYNKIKEIRDKALAGEDFGELAVEFSEDPSARDMTDQTGNKILRKGNRGDLGYFTVFDMVYPFENAAFTTPEGQISDIIRTRFGYHILKITDNKEAMGNAKVAHVFIRMPEGATAEDSAKAEEKINIAYEDLTGGKSFEEVVFKYSEDKGSKEKGGELPPFGSNRMVPDFIYEISQLENPGDYSEPFITSYGWHIVKLIELNTPGTFDEEKDDINKRLARDTRSHKSEEAVISKIKKDYKFKEYTKNINALYETMDTNLLKGEWDVNKAEGMNKPVFKLGKQKYLQGQLAEFIAERQKKERAVAVEPYFYKSYDEFVRQSCVDYLDNRLEELYPDFGLLMKEYRDGILLFELTDQKVWSKAVNDTSGLEAFHAENKDKYMWDKRLEVKIFTVKDFNNIDTLQALFENNKNAGIFSDTSLFVPDNVSIKEKKFSKGENEMADQLLWMPGTFKIEPMGKDAVIYLVEDVLPPQPKTLDESRGLVIADYQVVLEKEWLKELKEKYPVEVYEKVLNSIKGE